MTPPAARPVPQPDAASAPFWEAAARHELVIQRCGACDAFRHPPRPMCPSCHSMESRFEPSAGRGRVWSWVVAHPPVLPAFQDKAPYTVAVIELDEGVRMIGNVDGAPAPGMQVEVYFEDVEEGVALPQWKPI
ncbi:MAG: Zn-ribbon domain-containing OB-fold protein [Actinomycetota bacterium]